MILVQLVVGIGLLAAAVVALSTATGSSWTVATLSVLGVAALIGAIFTWRK